MFDGQSSAAADQHTGTLITRASRRQSIMKKVANHNSLPPFNIGAGEMLVASGRTT